jgi:hypothetical protein
MTALVWDQVGERHYETGIDRGVLYLPDGGAVPWNGLTSVTENLTRDMKPYYLDGVRYLAVITPGAYSGKLSAFTYPDELDLLTGVSPSGDIFLHDQSYKMFNLSYRTRVGNDIAGVDFGYKIHILWNILADPGDRTYDSLSDSLDPAAFEWNLLAVTESMLGTRPTSHVSVSSESAKIAEIEALLYGTEDTMPSLPPLIDFVNMFA